MNEALKRRLRSLQKLSVVQQQQGEEKDDGYFLVIPSKRYFKRVFNKEYQTQNKQQPKQKQQLLNRQEEAFVRSLQHCNRLQEPKSEESLYNFSMGLFRKPQNDNNSIFDTSSLTERKSEERKLDFSKIFIVKQNTPFKQIIQLSQRENENKNMLEKAVQELQKRKLQKKFKMLKKQMKIQVSKYKQLDQSIEDLRCHKIGYKTFYKKQILAQKTKNMEQSTQRNKQKQKDSKSIDRKKKLLTELAVQKLLNKEKSLSQQQNISLLNDSIETRRRNKTKIELTQKLKCNDAQSIPRQKRRILHEFDHRTLNESQIVQSLSKEGITKDSHRKDSKKRFPTQIDKKQSYSSLTPSKFNTPQTKNLKQNFNNVQCLPNIIKSSQNLYKNIRNSKNLLNPSEKLSNLINTNSVRNKAESNRKQTNNIFDDQFTFLLSKQELQNTLNKSRYEIKKLLCLHIQNRKRQWRRNKSKSLLDEKFLQQTYKQISKSQKKFLSELAPIEEIPKQMQNSRYFEKVRSTGIIIPAPTHLMKLHTKQLKKSIKSFVRKIKGSSSPPKKNLRNSPELK